MMTCKRAIAVAEAINSWAGKDNRVEVITPEEVLNLTPVLSHDSAEAQILAVQWGDVTVLAWPISDDEVIVNHVFW